MGAAALILVAVLAACSDTKEIPSPTQDVDAAVQTAVAQALPTATPTATPDIDATIQTGMAATMAAIPPTPTPIPDLGDMVSRVRPGVVRITSGTTEGTGVIYAFHGQTGYVVTNYHVVEGWSRVSVMVNDSTWYRGPVVEVDQIRDLAVLSICCGNFIALEFGDATSLAVGDEVVNIGYALGIEGAATVTRGIVSAMRYDADHQAYVIQSDAAINPGNSGGPMLSPEGRVLGINTFAYVSGYGAEGIGFAISAVTVQQRIPGLTGGRAIPTPTPAPTRIPTPRPVPTATAVPPISTPLPRPTPTPTPTLTPNPSLTNNPGSDVVPGWSPDGGRIAFLSDRGGGFELYVLNTDGSGSTRLTNDWSGTITPRQWSWSPDGRRIAFVTASDIYIVNADGSSLTQLTDSTRSQGDYYPSWSPDARRVAFHRGDAVKSNIYVVNADGSGLTQLTNDPDRQDYQTSWSPDGQRIALASIQDGKSGVYVMNADGSGFTHLTDSMGSHSDPSWSPDGRHIAFLSYRGQGNRYIYVSNADGSGLTRLTDKVGQFSRPIWSPDGRRIAFESGPVGSSEDYIYVMNADGSGLTRLTDSRGTGYDLSWSPDGQRIAFSSDRDGNWEIYIVNVPGDS